MLSSQKATLYTGTYNDLRQVPELQDYLDPEFNPLVFDSAAGGRHLMDCLQTLDLMASVSQSPTQNIAEPGMGYVSSLCFRTSQDTGGDYGGQLLLERLNDNGVGDNFRISGTLPEGAPHYEFVQDLLNDPSRLVWYWGESAHTHPATRGGWQNSTPLSADQLVQLNECLSWLLSTASFELVFPEM